MDYTQWARDTFCHDLYATEQTGIEIDHAEPGHAVCSMVITPQHKNALGQVMGGALFTLADFTFAVASNTDKAPTVSLHAGISYLGKATGDKLTATARCIKEGRSTCFYTVDITDSNNHAVAAVTIDGFIKRP